MAIAKRTDRIIVPSLLIASILVSLSVFTVPVELLDSDHHNPFSFSQSNENPTDGFAKVSNRNNPPDESSKYHVVFSTGCSIFQDWQSYVFFYHVLQSGQLGLVTRIVSGCDESQKQELDRIFQAEIASMAPGRFHLHHTPDYSKIKTGVNYVFFNKPYGMKHWMENVLRYPTDDKHDDDIIILLDPDEIIKRPFTHEFQFDSEVWKTNGPKSLRVAHGSPFAQLFGFGRRWRSQMDFTKIFPNTTTPIRKLRKEEVENYYHAMGPPYIATARDMYRIVKVWSEVVPRVHDQFPELLAEMFGYNIAAAHLGLQHTLAKSFMLSSVMTYKIEAWEKLVDPLPSDRVCAADLPLESYPHVIHYCQRYGVGKWFFNKYRWNQKKKTSLMSCDAPLLKEPPPNLVDLYTSAIYPEKNLVVPLPLKQRKQVAFMLCNIIRDVNRAILHYKQHHCDQSSVNYEYSFTFFTNMTWEG